MSRIAESPHSANTHQRTEHFGLSDMRSPFDEAVVNSIECLLPSWPAASHFDGPKHGRRHCTVSDGSESSGLHATQASAETDVCDFVTSKDFGIGG